VPPVNWRRGVNGTIRKARESFPPVLEIMNVLYFKTIILPFVLYGCETWSLTLRED
jgi:hypothetical protein